VSSGNASTDFDTPYLFVSGMFGSSWIDISNTRSAKLLRKALMETMSFSRNMILVGHLL
jgi:hypothetical protein